MRGSSASAEEGPDRTIRPVSSTYAREETFIACRTFCSTSRMVVPDALISRTIRKMSATTSGASPRVGSSSSRSLGADRSARAMASICCSPPEREPPGCPWRCRSTGNRSITRSMSAATPRSRRTYAPISRFSRTVIRERIARPSGTSATPRRRIACGGSPAMSSPRKRIAPVRGERTPAIVRISVVFPAPFAPMMPTMAPSGTSMDTSRRARIFPYHVSRARTSSIPFPFRGTEVRLDHPGILPDGRRRPLGDLPSEIEHHEAVARFHHQRHVVLDEEDRHPQFPYFPDQAEHLRRLRLVHPRRRFVQKEEARLRGQRPGDLQPPLVAVREAARRLPGIRPGQAHQVEEFPRPFPDPPLLFPFPPRAQDAPPHPRAGAAMAAHHHVLLHRHGAEETDVLEGTADAPAGNGVGGKAGGRLPVEDHRPFRGREEGGDHVEEGRLAGAVRADHPHDLAGVHGKGDVR